MTSKCILVTGGAGFIGGHFIHLIINRYPDYKIVNVDMLTNASDLEKHKPLQFNTNYKFYPISTMDEAKLHTLFKMERFDYVVNFAAESHVDHSIANPSLFTHANVVGTQNLLNLCVQYHVEKFIHISTDEVYGELSMDSKDLFTEESPVKPRSPYSASKAASDLLVQAYHETYNLPVIITRCSNNYGPYQMPEKLIPLSISKALNNEPITLYGDGKNVRDWLYVQDHCEAVDFIMHNGQIGEVYNIGGNEEKTNIEIAKHILWLLKKPEHFITFIQDRPGHDLRYAINAEKLRKLGWAPKVSFSKGIEHTVSWYIQNEPWVRRHVEKLRRGTA